MQTMARCHDRNRMETEKLTIETIETIEMIEVTGENFIFQFPGFPVSRFPNFTFIFTFSLSLFPPASPGLTQTPASSRPSHPPGGRPIGRAWEGWGAKTRAILPRWRVFYGRRGLAASPRRRRNKTLSRGVRFYAGCADFPKKEVAILCAGSCRTECAEPCPGSGSLAAACDGPNGRPQKHRVLLLTSWKWRIHREER
jgi:hypothetical protein